MKINFDLLQASTKKQSEFPQNIFLEKQARQSSHYHPPQAFSQYFSSYDKEENKNKYKITDKNDSFYEYIKKVDAVKPQKPREYMNNKDIVKRKINEKQLIKRLYENCNCRKLQCSQYKTARQIQTIENKYFININQKCKKKQGNPKAKNQLGRWPTHLRLYNQGKIKESIRRINQQQQIAQNHPQILSTMTSKHYMQSYIPFYKRLSSQITKSRQKLKYYDRNPHLSSNQQKGFFELSLVPNKYRQQAQSRYKRASSKQTIQTQHQLYNSLNSSFNSSFYSSQISLELIYQIQQHFFNKMKCIFIQASSPQQIVITQQIIQILTQVQFKLLQSFILSIEKNGLRVQDFQYKLRQHYYSLPSHERAELRNHELKRKNNKNNGKQQQKMKIRDKDDTKVKISSNLQINTKYLKKIQYYV